MRYLVAAFIVLLFAGCASTGLTEKGERAYFQAQQEAASEPIMEMSCPDSGCNFTSLIVNNPGNNNIRSLAVRNPTLEITQSLLRTATTVAPWLAVTEIAVEGISQASGDRSSVVRDSNNSQRITETVQTSERGDTFGNSASVVGRDSIGDNSGRNAGTSGRINSPDNDATGTPTIVEQPAPVGVQPQSPPPSSVQ